MPTIRISAATYSALSALAEAEHDSKVALIDRAVEEYRRNRFLDLLNERFAALYAETEARAAAREEER